MNFALENSVLVQVHTQALAGAASIRLKPLAGVPPWKMPPNVTAGKPYGTLTLLDRLDSSAAKIEIAWYTGRTDNGDGTYTYTGLLRGQEGSTARQWEVGEWATQAPTVRALSTEMLFAKQNMALAFKHRADKLLKWDGTNFDFDTFTAISVGRGAHWATGGGFSIVRPTTTTVIAGYGGHAGATVVAGGIPMVGQSSLFYELPINGTGAGVNANFRLVSNSGDFVVPAHWVLVATFPSADGADLSLRTCDGAYLPVWNAVGAGGQPAFAGAWANFGSGFAPASFVKDLDQMVSLRGMVTGGAFPSTVFTLPAGYRPETNGNLIFPAVAGSAFGEVRVASTGVVTAQTGATWISLDACRFKATQ